MQIIDLSKRLSQATAVYPGDRPVEFENQASYDQGGYYLTRLHMSTHTGTHVDAPMHFVRGGSGVSEMSLESCAGPASIIDLHPLNADEKITPAHLQRHEALFQPGARIILRTGWTEKCPPDAAGHFTEHPVLDPDTCRWIAERRPALLGLDLPSTHTRDNVATHGPLLGAGIVLLEGLVNLDQLPERFTLVALPLPLENLDGSPVRAVALIDGIM